jgi:HTH-type transcriptional regulator, sugar sensing transcriptional regulator
MDENLINLLKKTGFSEKEARIYLAVLELGKGDVTEIAKKAELKRSIAYVIIDELIEKGYASKLPNRKINTYQAIDPGVILNSIKTTTKHFSEMLPYLRSLNAKEGRLPKIHFIDNKEGIFKVYEDMNAHQDQFFISSYSHIEKYFPGEIKKWVDNYRKGRYTFKGRHLIANDPEDLALISEFTSIGQQVRILPGLKKSQMDFSVYGNKLAITAFEESPYIVVIESKGIVDSLMPILEVAWKSGKEI